MYAERNIICRILRGPWTFEFCGHNIRISNYIVITLHCTSRYKWVHIHIRLDLEVETQE